MGEVGEQILKNLDMEGKNNVFLILQIEDNMVTAIQKKYYTILTPAIEIVVLSHK